MTTSTVDREAVEFFRLHAGYMVRKGQSIAEAMEESARTLADAERRLKAGPYFVSLEPDPEGWDADVEWCGPVWIMTLWDVADETTPHTLGSLAGIGAYEGDPYLRVVAAELAAASLPGSDS